MNVNIITIGDEILIGQIVDTNSSWLAQELTKLGFNINKNLSISDKATCITDTLKSSLNEADVIIFTGGLGPTNDDVTKKTLANFFNSALVESEQVLEDILGVLKEKNLPLNKLNKKQALVPKCAEILPNKQGTASGLLFHTVNNKVVISLPGVPYEMKGIMQQYGFKRLTNIFTLPTNYYKTILVCNIPESQLAEKLSEWEKNLPKNIKLAYLPSLGMVRLRLGITDNKTKTELEEYISTYIKQLYDIIPNNICADEDVSLQELTGKLLQQHKLTLSTAESCTGGGIAELITSVAGSSAYYKGSVVAYSNEIKADILHVSENTLKQHGAVSEQCVTEMATNISQLFKTDCSIAVSGIAGPSGGSKQKPVGTVWICVNYRNKLKTKCFAFGNNRQINTHKAKTSALQMLCSLIMQE